MKANLIFRSVPVCAAALLLLFCGACQCNDKTAPLTNALDADAWQVSEWISVGNAPVTDYRVHGNRLHGIGERGRMQRTLGFAQRVTFRPHIPLVGKRHRFPVQGNRVAHAARGVKRRLVVCFGIGLHGKKDKKIFAFFA